MQSFWLNANHLIRQRVLLEPIIQATASMQANLRCNYIIIYAVTIRAQALGGEHVRYHLMSIWMGTAPQKLSELCIAPLNFSNFIGST